MASLISAQKSIARHSNQYPSTPILPILLNIPESSLLPLTYEDQINTTSQVRYFIRIVALAQG